MEDKCSIIICYHILIHVASLERALIIINHLEGRHGLEGRQRFVVVEWDLGVSGELEHVSGG